MASADGFALGIDLGTTSVKLSLVDVNTRQCVLNTQAESKATVAADPKCRGVVEQDVKRIFKTVDSLVAAVPSHELEKVQFVSVCGQMHGCVLWAGTPSLSSEPRTIAECLPPSISHLVTWEDRRCSQEFLASLPRPTHGRLSSGHGCATLAWLHRYRADALKDYQRGGTVMDLLVACMCGRYERPLMSTQNAASWGYYDCRTESWETERLQSFDFPVDFLPETVPAGKQAGRLQQSFHGIPAGVPVYVAVGDMQCSVYSALQRPNEAVVNISTSAQMSCVLTESQLVTVREQHPSVECWPYFGDHHLAVAASLNGGNVLMSFVDMLKEWVMELCQIAPNTDNVFAHLITAGHKKMTSRGKGEEQVMIIPRVFGERHDPSSRASVNTIGPTNTSLGCLFAALCRGLVRNLHELMPLSFLKSVGVTSIVGTGNALLRNSVLQLAVGECYHLPVSLCPNSDASVGAALSILDASKKLL